MAISKQILDTLIHTLSSDKSFIPLHEPTFVGNEWTYVKKCLDSTFVSSVGEFVDRFEEMIVDYTGIRSAVAVVNGTAALHIAVKLAGVEPGDEVLVPALTFVATANAVQYCGAIPHFVDSDEQTLGMDPARLEDYLKDISEFRNQDCYNRETGRRIRAAVPMHTYGHPVDLDVLSEVCRRYKLRMVEDAAESLGSFYKERHTGNWGDLSVISFNGNKIVTTGGGGVILTNDEKLGKLAKHITTTAKRPHQWEFYHDQIGYNLRMPNINAALGCAQIENLPTFLQNKRQLAEKYAQAFDGIDGVSYFSEPLFAKSNYWLNVILLDETDCATRDSVLKITNDNGIMTRPAWTLMHKLPMYNGCPRMEVPVAESLEARLINIPSSAGL